MATAVLDVDFDHLPPSVTGLERYQNAHILVRLGGRPVGQTTVPVTDGCIGGSELREALLEAAGWRLWEQWLHNLLEWDERPASSMRPSATVAVCTRDRPEDLQRCLEALLRLPDDGQELMVIDNCPATEDTRRLVERYGGVRYVRENTPGASAARNRALREARHEIVAFSDDDAAPDPGWLRALLRNFHDPLVFCVTGLTMPLELETEAQEWFESHSPFGRGFKRFMLDGGDSNPLHVARAGTSANMALRKTVREHVGFFDEALGPGTRSRTGEDFDMFLRILTSGYRIVYDPAALSWHRHRRTWQELRTTLRGYGVGVYAFLTRSLLVEREIAAPFICWGWFRYVQCPALVRSLLCRPERKPLDLLFAELGGCLGGPWAYFSSRRQLRRRSR
ncbi:MAG TPA: glycosyltransferase [Nitrospiraceae bacterium]|nr:glycosyltransferase [Nitrospiraceae bacterium]